MKAPQAILRTRKQAERYVETLFALRGVRHLVFRVPKGSPAYELGYRFGTCEPTEVEAYRRSGALFV